MQKRGLHLVEALLLHVAANGGNHLEALLERGLHLGIHDQIDIALAIARLLVGKPVELLGKRAQRLRQKLERLDGDGKLAAARAHHGSVHADPVAHVEVFQLGERILAKSVHAAEKLHVGRGVAQLEEGELALIALRHDAAGDGDRILGALAVLKTRVSLVQIGDVMGVGERVTVRVLARVDHRLALVTTNLDGVVFDNLFGGFVGHAMFLRITDRVQRKGRAQPSVPA